LGCATQHATPPQKTEKRTEQPGSSLLQALFMLFCGAGTVAAAAEDEDEDEDEGEEAEEGSLLFDCGKASLGIGNRAAGNAE